MRVIYSLFIVGIGVVAGEEECVAQVVVHDLASIVNESVAAAEAAEAEGRRLSISEWTTAAYPFQKLADNINSWKETLTQQTVTAIESNADLNAFVNSVARYASLTSLTMAAVQTSADAEIEAKNQALNVMKAQMMVFQDQNDQSTDLFGSMQARAEAAEAKVTLLEQISGDNPAPWINVQDTTADTLNSIATAQKNTIMNQQACEARYQALNVKYSECMQDSNEMCSRQKATLSIEKDQNCSEQVNTQSTNCSLEKMNLRDQLAAQTESCEDKNTALLASQDAFRNECEGAKDNLTARIISTATQCSESQSKANQKYHADNLALVQSYNGQIQTCNNQINEANQATENVRNSQQKAIDSSTSSLAIAAQELEHYKGECKQHLKLMRQRLEEAEAGMVMSVLTTEGTNMMATNFQNLVPQAMAPVYY
jgi:hypothetical protein